MSKILITGGTGFLGRHLAQHFSEDEVILTGRNNKQNQFAKFLTKREVCPIDITNIEAVREVISYYKPEIVIHAAATKFVDLSEKFPMECVDVNITGSQNVARVCIDKGVKQVLGISTDKAAPPVKNIYGLSKAVMEKMFCSLNGKTDTQFSCVRYGNVAWSTGSVLPIWENMLRTTGVIQSTGPNMRRFFFTVEEACELVYTAVKNTSFSGKILSREMKSSEMVNILNVWTNFQQNGKWETIPERPGDRLDEFLIGEEEIEYTTELELNGIKHYVLHHNTKQDNHILETVNSNNATRLTQEDIYKILTSKPMDA